MTNNNNSSSNSINNHPKNLIEFESQEVKHKFGLNKFSDIPTEALVVAARNIIEYRPTSPVSTDGYSIYGLTILV